MTRIAILALVAGSLIATPLLAGPPAKRPTCQVLKSPARDVRREPCRRGQIPPVLDRMPIFLISTEGRPLAPSDLA